MELGSSAIGSSEVGAFGGGSVVAGSTEDRSPGGRLRTLVGVALAAGAIVVVAGVASVIWPDHSASQPERSVAGGDGPWTLAAPLGDGAPSLPADVAEGWTLEPVADRDAPIAWGRTAVARVVAAEVMVYDLADGELRWRAPFVGADPAIAFSDEAVVVVTTTGDSDVTIVGLDPADGTLLWRRRADHAVAIPGPGAPVVFDGRRDRVVMRVLDPRTGEDVGEPAEPVKMSTATPYFVTLVGDLLAVLDLRNGTRVGPAVPADGLRAITPVGQRIVGLSDDDELVLFDEAGDAVDRRRVDDLVDPTARATMAFPELVGEVPGTTLGIVAGATSIGFDVSSGAIEPVWEFDGRVRPPVRTEIGPVAAVSVTDPASGRVGHALVDARDGSTLAVSESGLASSAAPVIGADGFVVATAFGDGRRSVSAFGFDGDERWHVSLPAAASFEVAPGTLLVLEPSGSISAFS